MRNLFQYGWLVLVLNLVSFSELFANEGAASGGGNPWVAPAIGFAVGLAVFAAASAQGRIGSAYLEGASRNPGAEKVMKTPMILSLIFVETLVLFTVLIGFSLLPKV